VRENNMKKEPGEERKKELIKKKDGRMIR